MWLRKLRGVVEWPEKGVVYDLKGGVVKEGRGLEEVRGVVEWGTGCRLWIEGKWLNIRRGVVE